MGVPDMVLVDMEVTVLALPAMEVTVLDTVSGRDLLMPGMDADMEVMADTAVDMGDTVDTVERDLLMPGTDVTTVDTEDTDMVDTDTESKFHTSINLLPFKLILVIIPAETMHYSIPSTKENQIIFRHVSSKLRKSFEIDQKVNLKNNRNNKNMQYFYTFICILPQSNNYC